MVDIVSRLKKDDYNAFVKLYDLLHKKVYHFFLKRTSSPETAEELTQDAFVKLWRYRHSLSFEHHIEKQLFTICFGLLINHGKQEKNIKHSLDNYLEMARDENINTVQQEIEVEDQLLKAIDLLPPASKKVVSLKIIKGFSNTEIAEELSISPKTVEGHITKAYKMLQKVIHLLLSLASLIALH